MFVWLGEGYFIRFCDWAYKMFDKMSLRDCVVFMFINGPMLEISS